MEPSTLVGEAALLLGIVAFLLVARALWLHMRAGPGNRAAHHLVAWALFFSLVGGIGLVKTELDAQGRLEPDAFHALTILGIGVSLAAACAFLVFLVYLATGSYRLAPAVYALYGGAFLAAMPFALSIDPATYAVSAPLMPSALAGLVVALQVAPALGALVVLGPQLSRPWDRARRYRMSVLLATTVAWALSSLAATLAHLAGGSEVHQFVARVAYLLVAVLAVSAYSPPAWVRARLGDALDARTESAAGR